MVKIARKREKVDQYEYKVHTLTEEVARIQQMLKEKQDALTKATQNLAIAKTDAMDLVDQSTEELENNLQEIEEINRKVRANLDKQKAEEDARQAELEWENKDAALKKARQDKLDFCKWCQPTIGRIVNRGQCFDLQRSEMGQHVFRRATDCGYVYRTKIKSRMRDGTC